MRVVFGKLPLSRPLKWGLLTMVTVPAFAVLAYSLPPAEMTAKLATIMISQQDSPLLTGDAAFGDYTKDAPGTRRKIVPLDLPDPATSVTARSEVVRRPTNAWPRTLPGFTVQLYTEGLSRPRKIVTAPNGDLFVVELGAGRIRVLRGTTSTGRVQQTSNFVTGLSSPFGLAFYPSNSANPTHLYIGTANAIIRVPYQNGDLTARSNPQTVVNAARLPGGVGSWSGGHSTRDVAFSPDNSKMYVAVGSLSNVGENNANEINRACILEFNPDGTGGRVFSDGIRNPVSLAIHPVSGKLWTTCNERDGLGDNLVPDYVTSVPNGGFFGWPYFYKNYRGTINDSRWRTLPSGVESRRATVRTPDVLLQAHSAPIGLTPYTGQQFPDYYKNGFFVASRGSWNRSLRTGYKIIFVRTDQRTGEALGEYMDFVTGFVVNNNQVYGRPAGVTMGRDGSLLFSDDDGGNVWRVMYTRTRNPRP